MSYRWNSFQNDAELVPASGLKTILCIINKNDVPRPQTWLCPSQTECLISHKRAKESILALNTLQLSLFYHEDFHGMNQIKRVAGKGFVEGVPDNVWSHPAYTATDDANKSLEYRARSCLGVNYSYYHRPGGPTRARWDVRFYTPTDQMGLIDKNVRIYSFWKEQKRIQERDPEKSMIAHRLGLLEPYYIPLLDSYKVNLEGGEFISKWIRDVIPTTPSSGAWQKNHFESLPFTDGGLEEDPDEDKRPNHFDFLRGTAPLTPDADAWKVTIAREAAHV